MTCLFIKDNFTLEVQNERFTVIKDLSCEVLMGHEALTSFNFCVHEHGVKLDYISSSMSKRNRVLEMVPVNKINTEERGNCTQVANFESRHK